MDESTHFAGLDIGGTTVRPLYLTVPEDKLVKVLNFAHTEVMDLKLLSSSCICLKQFALMHSVDIPTIAAVGIDVPAIFKWSYLGTS